MRWRRPLILPASLVTLLAAWVALAAWQRHEYGHECHLAEEMVCRQAESVMSALVGGIRSHRRLGNYFPEQLQGALDELTGSKDVLAVAVVSQGGSLMLTSGETSLLDTSPPTEPGQFWQASGFCYVAEFHLEPDADRPWGQGGGGRGSGRGRGWGRGLGNPETAQSPSPLSTGGRFVAMLLLDRARADDMRVRAFWLRVWVVAAGGLVLVFIGLAWWATVRLVEARGRTQVLESEARHLRDLSQAAAGLAHETRNPLGLIRGWAQRLGDSGLPSTDQRRQVQAVVEECDRVAARINQFLAFAKPCLPAAAPIDPEHVIAELAALLEPDLDVKGLTLCRSAACPGLRILADREMLRQALFNLVQNAIQFAPQHGVVEVTVQGRNGECRIEVADRGPGVPADKRELLFTPYFTTRPKGTGLGLAIVQRIAAAHGWQAGYTPRPGGGSIFWLDRIHG